jgi:hypothetical protein
MPSNVVLLMEKQEDFQRNKLKTWLNNGLLSSLSSEQAKDWNKLISIFYASNSVTREVLSALSNQKLDEQARILTNDIIEENRHIAELLDMLIIPENAG